MVTNGAYVVTEAWARVAVQLRVMLGHEAGQLGNDISPLAARRLS